MNIFTISQKKSNGLLLTYFLLPLLTLVSIAGLRFYAGEVPKIAPLEKMVAEQRQEINILQTAIIEIAEKANMLDSIFIKKFLLKAQ